VGQAEGQRPLVGLGREERRRQRQAFGEEENFGPAGARTLIIVDQHRAAALARPLLQGFAVIDEPNCGPVDALDVQNALGRFAPGARHVADHHHAHAAALDRFFHAHIRECHGCPARVMEAYRQSSRT